MENHLYIVLWRVNETRKWSVEQVVSTAAERDIIVAAAKIKNSEFQYAWVEGPITSPEAMAEQEAALGVF